MVISLAPRHDVAADVADGMTDVQAGARGVGEHVEHVELRLLPVEVRLPRVGRGERAVVPPEVLPAPFDTSRLVVLLHRDRLETPRPAVNGRVVAA